MNWKTTVSGALAALLPYVKPLVEAHWPGLGVIVDAAAALALAVMGYFAADKKA